MIHLFEVSKIIAINYIKINNYIFNSDTFRKILLLLSSIFYRILLFKYSRDYRIHCLFNDEAIRMIHTPLFC